MRSPAICVASELVGLAVAEHRASAGHSSAFLGLIALLPAYSGCSYLVDTSSPSRLDTWVLKFCRCVAGSSGSMSRCQRPQAA